MSNCKCETPCNVCSCKDQELTDEERRKLEESYVAEARIDRLKLKGRD